jgi:hypothetical protein
LTWPPSSSWRRRWRRDKHSQTPQISVDSRLDCTLIELVRQGDHMSRQSNPMIDHMPRQSNPMINISQDLFFNLLMILHCSSLWPLISLLVPLLVDGGGLEH